MVDLEETRRRGVGVLRPEGEEGRAERDPALQDGARDLTREGAAGWEFIVLVEGEADVRSKGRKVNELGPGDFVGEISLVTGRPRTATVRTRGPARILVLAATGFRTLMQDVPSIQDKVLAAVTARLPDD